MGNSPSRPPPSPLPPKSSRLEKTFQPAFDYDRDSCYPVPAISAGGEVATGLPLSGTVASKCRTASRLGSTNSYSRYKCDAGSGWVGIVYTLYFEKDQVSWGPGSLGHRHDWEHVVVWVRVGRASSATGPAKVTSEVRYVATSRHGRFVVHALPAVRFLVVNRNDNNSNDSTDAWPHETRHPKVVYHKDGWSTHCFRIAAPHDDPPENHSGRWQFPPLVGWDDGFPPGVREKLVAADFGKADFGIKDGNFQNNLRKAMPQEVRDAGFDVDGPDNIGWSAEEGLVPKATIKAGEK